MSTPKKLPATPSQLDRRLITHSAVTPNLPYKEYRQALRRDFFFTCAYCTISESEATAIRFTIDHYEPRHARPDLVNEYTNLMYACDVCNQRKGNRNPPPGARAKGVRFFRPDKDVYSDHFVCSGIRLESKTNIGHYSIEAIDLNRLSLRKLRDIRKRLTDCYPLVAEGVLALRAIHIDRLPKHVKGSAAGTIVKAVLLADQMAEEIDGLLRRFARAPLIDPDPEAEKRAQERFANLNDLKILLPGTWRAPKPGAPKGNAPNTRKRARERKHKK
jgi:hypothetical protein